jgi:hypothetical protein
MPMMREKLGQLALERRSTLTLMTAQRHHKKAFGAHPDVTSSWDRE